MNIKIVQAKSADGSQYLLLATFSGERGFSSAIAPIVPAHVRDYLTAGEHLVRTILADPRRHEWLDGFHPPMSSDPVAVSITATPLTQDRTVGDMHLLLSRGNRAKSYSIEYVATEPAVLCNYLAKLIGKMLGDLPEWL